MGTKTFNRFVEARTRVAVLVLGDPRLLDMYTAKSGLKADLERIRDLGVAAQANSSNRSQAQAAGTAATLTIAQQFDALSVEYRDIMNATHAVRHDLELAGASTDTLAAVDKVLVYEGDVLIREVVEKPDEKKKKVVIRSHGKEAVRSEIERDAARAQEPQGCPRRPRRPPGHGRPFEQARSRRARPLGQAGQSHRKPRRGPERHVVYP